MTASWRAVAPGVWTAELGSPQDVSPRALLAISPQLEAMAAQLPAACRPEIAGAFAAQASPGRFVVTIPLAADEAIWGLGLQFFRVNQRGRSRYLRVNSDPRQDTGETHAPVPFYVSSRGYGLLVDTARIVTAHCGSTVAKGSELDIKDRNNDRGWRPTPPSPQIELALSGAGARLYLFAGPSPLDVVRRYNLFNGGGVLPPRWGLGFWHRTPTRFTAAQVADEALEYRRRDFPCDVIGLEPGWHSASYPCTYVWSDERFPDPAAFVAQLAGAGFRVNLWEHPWVSPDAPIYAQLHPLSGSHSVWGGLAPDFTLARARDIYSDHHRRSHVEIGVSGYKLDECDGSELTSHSWMFPAHATFPSGLDGEQMRQVYGTLLQQLTTRWFAARDQRTYGLVRASGAGASTFPYVLYTDLYDSRQYVRALCNAGFSGLLFAPEVRKAKDAEDWVRRIQIACFSPLCMLNAWSDGTKPWSFPEVEGIVRKYLKLRMRLQPYFYAAFARYRFEGVPPFRALALADDPCGGSVADTAAPVDIRSVDDQYLAGDALLVAPMFAGQSSRTVILPAGTWYDFESGARFEGGQTLTVTPGLDQIPVFVRDGGIVPLTPALGHAPESDARVPLTVRHYGQRAGRFRLFDDDGETLAYLRGQYAWIDLCVDVRPDGTRVGRVGQTPERFGPISWEWLG